MKLSIGGYLKSTANIYGKTLYTQERVVLLTVTKLKYRINKLLCNCLRKHSNHCNIMHWILCGVTQHPRLSLNLNPWQFTQ